MAAYPTPQWPLTSHHLEDVMRRWFWSVPIAALGLVTVVACSSDGRSVADVLSPDGKRAPAVANRSHIALNDLQAALGNAATGANTAILRYETFGDDIQTAVHTSALQTKARHESGGLSLLAAD